MIVLGCNKDNRARAMLIVYNNKGVINCIIVDSKYAKWKLGLNTWWTCCIGTSIVEWYLHLYNMGNFRESVLNIQ